MSSRFPRYCHRRNALRFHRYSALHSEGFDSQQRLLFATLTAALKAVALSD